MKNFLVIPAHGDLIFPVKALPLIIASDKLTGILKIFQFYHLTLQCTFISIISFTPPNNVSKPWNRELISFSSLKALRFREVRWLKPVCSAMGTSQAHPSSLYWITWLWMYIISPQKDYTFFEMCLYFCILQALDKAFRGSAILPPHCPHSAQGLIKTCYFGSMRLL